MEYVLAFVAVAAFGYFLYKRVKAANKPRSGGSGGGGGGSRPKPELEEK